MWKMIKSIYRKVFILSYIDERRKLKLIKYNKNLQNYMNISLINYMLFSEKYIIKLDNGITRIYNAFDDELLYEGGFSNNKLNGYGKIFDDEGRILFEGEFLNNKKNGKGKEYNYRYSDIFVFDGEYLNDKKNGKGKSYYTDYDDNIKIDFEGEYLNNKEWSGKKYDSHGNIIYELNNGKGKVKQYYCDKIIFEGDYLDGEKNGKGAEYYDNGNILFEGEYLNNKKWNGIGYDINKNKIYEIKNGNGFIKEYCSNGTIKYEGEILNGEKNGKIKEYDYYGKLNFEGGYLNGVKNGKGKIYDSGSNDTYFEGEFLNGQKNGKGRKYKNGKLVFEGDYLNGVKHGKAKEYEYFTGKVEFDGEYLYGLIRKGKKYIRGILEYEGEYIYGEKWNGKGYDEDGHQIYELINGSGKIREYNSHYDLNFEGEYLNGLKNGYGKKYRLGTLEYEGEYLYGKRNGHGKEYEYFEDHSKLVFEGEFLNNSKWNGKGREYNHDKHIIYKGKYKFGVHYNGKELDYKYDNRLIYENIFLDGKLSDINIYDYYSRELLDEDKEKSLKEKYLKEKNKDLTNDIMVLFFPTTKKITFEGRVENGLKNGFGITFDNYGEKIFEGEFLNGKEWNGKGKEYEYYKYNNGKYNLIYEGEFKNGKRHGKGKEYFYFNKILFEGEYLNGQRWNGKLKEYNYDFERVSECEYIEGKIKK